MPGLSKFFIVRPMIGSEKISVENQKEYQLLVGILLFLVKHSRLDIAKMTRQLCIGCQNFPFEVGTDLECQQTMKNSLVQCYQLCRRSGK